MLSALRAGGMSFVQYGRADAIRLVPPQRDVKVRYSPVVSCKVAVARRVGVSEYRRP